MKVTTEALERCEILMTIEVEPAQEQELLKKAAQRISKQAPLPGFRPGKAPYNAVLRRYGPDVIREEAWGKSAEKLVTDALEQADLKPQAPIHLDEVKWEPLTIKVKVPGPSKIEPGNYRDIRLEATPVVVTDEDVDQALKTLQDQHATWTPVERPAAIGDLLTMSVVEKDGDEALNRNEAVEHELTSPPADEENRARVDISTPLLGLSAGESKTFTINYPDDWQQSRYAGKAITYEVAVSSVKAKELDPLDDEFAKSVGDVETLAELKDRLRANIQNRRQAEADHALGQQTLEKIIEGAEKIEWAAGLEEYRLEREVDDLEERIKRAGLTLDSYLQMQNTTKDELREKLRPNVVKALKTGLTLGKLAELESIEVSQMEILERARAIAYMSGGDDRIWQGMLTSPDSQAVLANNVLSDKVIDRLAAIAKGEAPALDAAPEPPAETEEKSAEAEVAAESVATA